MSSLNPVKDLVVLAADKDAEFALRGMLECPRKCGIRPISYDVFVHPDHDPGCRTRSQDVLRSQSGRYARAIVVFDQEGCGFESQERAALELAAEEHLDKAGWTKRCAAIVISPELEAWVWSDSPEVDAVLGWSGHEPSLRDWLRQQRLLSPGSGKPARPKETMRAALRYRRKPPSAALFRELALRVSYSRCKDESIRKLLTTLRRWFPESVP